MGLKAAVLASSCCSLPLALILVFGAVGAGSVSQALRIPQYKAFFLALGCLFLLVSLYLTIRRERGVCNLSWVCSERYLILSSLVSFAILTWILVYVILPAVSEWIFR